MTYDYIIDDAASTTLGTPVMSGDEYLGKDYPPGTFAKVDMDDVSPAAILTEFADRQEHQRALFIRKHAHYGSDNILSGDPTDPDTIKQSLRAIHIRMMDKINRFKTMIDNWEWLTDEPIEDTLDDLSNYCNIGIIVKNGKWKDG